MLFTKKHIEQVSSGKDDLLLQNMLQNHRRIGLTTVILIFCITLATIATVASGKSDMAYTEIAAAFGIMLGIAVLNFFILFKNLHKSWSPM